MHNTSDGFRFSDRESAVDDGLFLLRRTVVHVWNPNFDGPRDALASAAVG